MRFKTSNDKKILTDQETKVLQDVVTMFVTYPQVPPSVREKVDVAIAHLSENRVDTDRLLTYLLASFIENYLKEFIWAGVRTDGTKGL